MLPDQSPSRVKKAYEAMAPVYEFIGKYQAWTVAKSDDDCNFALGNPHEMPLPGFVAALEKALTPQDKDWFAYKINEPSAVDPVATALSQQFNRPYDPADIFMTNGATGGLDVVLNTVVGRDDEVIFISPP